MALDAYGNWVEDQPFLDLSDPSLAPPNSRWDGEKWITTTPNEAGYDKTWGGYTTGDPRGTSTGDQWLGSVYAHQGWELPPLPTTPPPTTTTTPPPKPPPTTTTTGGGGDWFDRIGASLGTYGALPAPYEDYTALERPDYLKGEYKAPVWDETFTAPTLDDLYNEPGYQARLDATQKASERSAAARGRVLSGGYGAALGKEMQNFASNEYGNVFNRAADTYKQRYGEFATGAQLQGQARGINENAFQSDALNHLNQYATRYRSYQDTIANTRNAETDRWNREMGLARLGLDATLGGRPS